MSLANPKNTEEKILSILTSGTRTTLGLLSEINKSLPLTKQGFYKALKILQREESVVIYKKNVSLDPIWIRNNLKILKIASDNYYETPENEGLILLEDGEDATYTFSNIKNLDTFWGHAQSAFMKTTPPNEPVYSFDPHYWFYLARQERESELLKEMVEQKRQFLMTVGDNSPLDKYIKKSFNNDYLQYNFNKFFDKNNYYVTIIDNYIIEVSLDSEISNKINQIFQNETTVNEQIKKDLENLLNKKGKNKIKITYNSKKATKLKARFKKDFYIIK